MRRVVVIPLALGTVSLAVAAVSLAVTPRTMAFAYLAAVVFGTGTALGALFFLMITTTARARWFVAIRRATEAVASTLPLFALLFVPIAFSLDMLYPWTHPEDVHDEELRRILLHQRVWLNEPFFVARAFLYFAIWIVLFRILRLASVENDVRARPELVARQRRVSAIGLPILAITATGAAFDWVMSLVPGWTSDMYGVIFFASGLVGAVGATAVVTYAACRAALLPPELSADHFHALGRVMFMTVVFWTYVNFMQFMLVWVANLPREVLFYVPRGAQPWVVLSAVVFAGHFLLPFFLLLSRELKRRPPVLAAIGAWVLAMHAIDTYWEVVPGHAGAGHPLDVFPMLGVLGLAVAFGAWRFFGAPPTPVNDPDLPQSLRYESP